MENDWFVGSDANYTGGFSLWYETDDLHKYRSDASMQRLTAWRHRLPGFGGERHERITFAFSTLAFTPEDIDVEVPDPDEPPYVGTAVVDAHMTSRSLKNQHAWNFRLGWVGPSSKVDEFHKFIHDLEGSDKPRGWDAQVPDEIVFNAGYGYAWRMREGTFNNGLNWDVTPGVGASVGNYFTGANASVLFRMGNNLSNRYGTSTIDSGVHSSHSIAALPGNAWRYEVNFGLAAFAIGHYLPMDGTMFHSSPSVDHDDVVGIASLGVTVARDALQLALLFNVHSDPFDVDVPRTRYASLNITWFTD